MQKEHDWISMVLPQCVNSTAAILGSLWEKMPASCKSYDKCVFAEAARFHDKIPSRVSGSVTGS